jgi:hypothetical protein
MFLQTGFVSIVEISPEIASPLHMKVKLPPVSPSFRNNLPAGTPKPKGDMPSSTVMESGSIAAVTSGHVGVENVKIVQSEFENSG